jgi:hypothetical protein
MAEILVGSNFPIKHRVFWKGEPTQADDLPEVDVYDITEDPAITPPVDPTEILTTLTAEESLTDIGTYNVYLPLSITNSNKQLKLVWRYQVEGDDVEKEHKVFVTTPYTDLSQAVDALGFGWDPSDPNYKTYSELVAAERYARKTIEAYTGQSFYLYNDLHIVYGDGSDSLRLPFRISQLHELYENDILLVDNINEINNWNYTTQISESNFGIRINRADMIDNTVYTANGMVPPTINDNYYGVFRKGVPYRVQGVYGWENVPDEIELGCIELMKDYFSKDRKWRDKYLHSVQSFDWHFEFNTGAYMGTGNMYVDQLLLPYVLTQMVVI